MAVDIPASHPDKRNIQERVKEMNDEVNKETVHNILGSLYDYDHARLSPYHS